MVPGSVSTQAAPSLDLRLDDALVERLRGQCDELGLLRIGAISLDHPLLARARAALREYLDAGKPGEMEFMTRTAEVRADPAQMLPGARSALVALVPHAGESGPIARYAQFSDYHTEVHRRIKELGRRLQVELPGAEVLVCVDTKPVLERSFALLAGLGFLGKNGCLIAPGLGSYLMIGVLLTTAAWVGSDAADPRLFEPEAAPWDACGSCTRCLDLCPTQAFDAPGRLDPRRCISYLTIEHRGPIEPALAERMGERIAGCDVCQEVCPYNRSETREQRIPSSAWLPLPPSGPRVVDLARLALVGNNQHRQFVKHTPLNRIPRRSLRRNALLALGNRTGPLSEAEIAALRACMDEPELAEVARWAAARRGFVG